MNKQRGFTLIELMIVVAVVAILATIAYPSYQDSIRKSRRAEAKRGLVEMQALQEKFRTSNPTYTSTVANVQPADSDYYTFAPSLASATGYTLTATAKNAQTSDTGCTTLTLVVSGSSVTKSPSACW